jgi:uncharacterized protein (DUF1499 family)
MDGDAYTKLVDRAVALGFNTAELIQVKHDRTAKGFLLEGTEKMALNAANILTPCPKSPNCVSSLAEDKQHFIEPIPYNGEIAVTRHKLLEILDSFKRVRVVRIEEKYIHAEFVSSVFRFVDDVEFYFDDAKKVIQMKSASRAGYSDLGVNRRRMEKIRKRFNSQQTN